jgi:hypothetical protein
LTRIAPALQQLISQVGGKVIEEPDGFGVYRSAKLTAKESKGLDQVILSDSRIASVETVGKSTVVTVVPTSKADSSHPF